MKGKLGLIVGLGAGYVLGTRDGRERYEQIQQQWHKVINDPRVQEKASQATDLAKEKAPLVKDKVGGVASKATSKIGGGSDSGVSTGSGLDDLDSLDSVDSVGTSGNSGGFHSTDGLEGAGLDDVDGMDGMGSHDATDSIASDDVLDEDAIILTPPSPSPLAPGPTDTSSVEGSHG